MNKVEKNNNSASKFFKWLQNYKSQIVLLLFVSFIANGIGLAIPRLIGYFIDEYGRTQKLEVLQISVSISFIAIIVVVFTILQTAISSKLSEKSAFDLRKSLAKSLSNQTNSYIQEQTPSKLLTISTSDVDAVKQTVSQGVGTAFAAILILFGSAAALLQINWRLALMVLAILPFIVLAFSQIFTRIGARFQLSQKNLEKINRIINESIVAASLVRVLNSQKSEIKKFEEVNQSSKKINLSIVNLFSILIPIVNLLSNVATLFILYYGGLLVVNNELSLGDFSAFLSYLTMLITPIFLLSFVSSGFSRALISFGRISEVLEASNEEVKGTKIVDLSGLIECKNIKLELNNHQILKNISFKIEPKSKNAILGPTAAGKTQIFNLLANILKPTSGEILLDGHKLEELDTKSFYAQIGLVFQDSIIFNTSLKDNILMIQDSQISETEAADRLKKAIYVSALEDLVQSLPDGLETQISERGSNLSGGQKQRLMLARALALNPKILLLDDFTARVDFATESQILSRLFEIYPDITLISITQKIEPIKEYDQILVVMEGDLLASGKHDYLMKTCLEYKQIWESQQSSENN